MVDDPDAIWRPGYDGPPPVLGPAGAGADEQPPDRSDRAEPDESNGTARDDRSRRRRIAIGAGLGLALVAAAVAVGVSRPVEPSRSAIEQPDPSVFGGPAGRRLPDLATILWSIDIDGAGDHWVEVVGRDLVIAAVAETGSPALGADAAAAPVTTLVALDARTGAQRWTSQLSAHLRDVTVIGAVEDVLVLEQPGATGPMVTGVDVATGETRWSGAAASNGGHVGLVGTPLIARLPSPPDRLVSLIDATSGRHLGTIASDPMATGRPGGWSTDRRGTWYVIDDGEVVAHDLTSGLGDSRVIGRVDDASMPRIVVDDRVVVVADSGSLTLSEASERNPVTVSAEVPESIRSLTSVSGSNFVVTAPGSIVGASIEDDTVNVTWSLSQGALVEDHPVAGGTLLWVATRSGAGMQLVDALTGETVEHLTMMPGAMHALAVAGDGFVVLQSSELGRQLTAVDLDGTERWSIPGAAPVVVGDRIVVRATSNGLADASPTTSQRLRLTAYGDAD